MIKQLTTVCIVFIYCMLSLCLQPTTAATENHASSELKSEESFYGYAISLMDDGDYYRAISEFKRYIYFYPSGAFADSAYMNIGLSYFYAGKYTDAINWYNTHPTLLGKFSMKSYLLLGRSYYKLEKYNLALDVLLPGHDNLSGSKMDGESLYCAGLAYTKLDRYPEAKSIFESIHETSPYYSKAAQYANILNKNEYYPRKSRFTAGILSIVPGAGYAYCGSYRTAISSIIVNGLLAWAAYSEFDRGNNGSGGIFTLLFTGFYSGNIYGSIRTSARYNEYYKDQFQAQFKE